MNGDDVGVGDVDCQKELGVEGGEVELEGGEADGDEMEGRILGLRAYKRRHRRCRRGTD